MIPERFPLPQKVLFPHQQINEDQRILLHPGYKFFICDNCMTRFVKAALQIGEKPGTVFCCGAKPCMKATGEYERFVSNSG